MPLEQDNTCDVAVVGGGPSGLALASELRLQGVERVVVLERDSEAGGVPRHCGHYPFGMHEFGRPMKGPEYARRHVDRALNAGVDLRTGVTVTEIHKGGKLSLSSDAGTAALHARRVALCTGTRESSRAQRFISGWRPQGIINTGTLQAFVYLEKLKPFDRPVILGTELVSFSSLLTCRHAGIRPVAMIEPRARITAFALARGLPLVMGIPLHLQTQIRRVLGATRVEGVEIESGNGGVSVIETDGLICTGNFRPEAALARGGHLDIDPGTGGPMIDQFARSSDPAYFCAGNLLRPVETHNWCAREGRRTAAVIARHLAQKIPTHRVTCTPIRLAHPAIRYVMPQLLSHEDHEPALDQIQLRVAHAVRGRLVARADGREIWSGKINALPEKRLLVPLAALQVHCEAACIEIDLEVAT